MKKHMWLQVFLTLSVLIPISPGLIALGTIGGGEVSEISPPNKNEKNIKESLAAVPFCISAKISPDAKKVAYVGTDDKGIANVFVIEGGETKQVTFFETPEIAYFYWSHDSNKVLLLKDEERTGLLALYGVDIRFRKVSMYTKGFSSSCVKVFQVNKNKALIGINNRDPRFHDLYLLNLDSGELSLFLKNDAFAKFLVSDSLEIILKVKINDDGSWVVLTDKGDVFMQLTAQEAFQTEFLSYNEKKKAVYLLDNRFSDTNRLTMKSLDSGDEKVLGAQAKSDVDDILFVGGEPKAYASYYEQKKWHVIDSSVEKDIAFLEERMGTNFEIINQSEDGSSWIVSNSIPDKGNGIWLYDRGTKKLSEVFAPDKESLSKMYSMVVDSRDGYKLVCYYTLPREHDKGGYVDSPLPLVVIPHGGPFKARDRFEFNPYHQWLSSCGYVVLSVNFRLSSGFGKEFVNAGNGQWGKKAHLDVIDGVEHCIKKGITKRGKLAILGGSYGGYEALASLVFSSEYFACCVSVNGVSNLKTVLAHLPQFWERPSKPLSDKSLFFTRPAFVISMGGDPDTQEGSAYLKECSPINYLQHIKVPLLLVHGKNDHIVAESESRQIYESMKSNNKAVTYLFFPDEGHGTSKFPNKMAYLNSIELFLSEHLGGAYTPVSQEILGKSSAIISN